MDGAFSIGQVIKDKKLKKMPLNSSLANTSSDLVGNISFFYDGKIEEKTKKNSLFEERLKYQL